MRHLMLSMLVLSSCAPGAVAASRPVPSSSPASAPVVPDGATLDAQGIRELLAGVELDIGDERAKTAGAIQRAAAAEQRAASAEEKKIEAGVIGAVVGAVLAIIAAFFGGK